MVYIIWWRRAFLVLMGGALLVGTTWALLDAGARLGLPYLAGAFLLSLASGAVSWYAGPRAFGILMGACLLIGGFGVAILVLAGFMWQGLLAFISIIGFGFGPYAIGEIHRRSQRLP